MPTVRNCGVTSGNSSVFSVNRANVPKITSVTMATTVISGRLMAKSEMIIGERPPTPAHAVEPLVFAGVRRRAHSYGCFLRDTARRAEQQRVPRLHPRAHFDGLRRRITNPELDFCFLDDAVPEQHHERLETALVDGRDRNHRRLPNLARDMAVREQTAHEHTPRVRERHDDANLT